MGRKKPGRPSKLTPEIQVTIAKAIEKGNYIEVAAAVAGVSKDTLYEWLRRGARDSEQGVSSEYRVFSDAVKRAMASAEAAGVEVIRAAGKREWTALAWWLERKFPDRWGKRERIDVKTDLTVHIQVGSALPASVFGALGDGADATIKSLPEAEVIDAEIIPHRKTGKKLLTQV